MSACKSVVKPGLHTWTSVRAQSAYDHMVDMHAGAGSAVHRLQLHTDLLDAAVLLERLANDL